MDGMGEWHEIFGEWHEIFEDDPTTYPDNNRSVLVSFSNLDTVMIGRWWSDPNTGGVWLTRDMSETFLQHDLFVDGWWELPKKPKEMET